MLQVRSPSRQLTDPLTEVVPVQSHADMRRFIDFPYEHYRGDPHWVAPLRIEQRELLDTAKNPFFRHAEMQCFLARSKDRTCGRIAAILDHDDHAGRFPRIGAFGFFESIDSELVAAALLRSAKDWLGARGASVLRGPMNPSINHECGLLVDGFDSAACIMMTYNPPYYERLFESAGFEKARDLYAYRLSCGGIKMDKLSRAMRVCPPQVRIRAAEMRHFDREIETIWGIYNNAWRENWGSVPMTLDEMRYLGRQLKSIAIPKLAVFAEISGQAVAFGLAVPDINQALKHANGSLFPLGLLKILYYKSRITKLRVLALGVLPEHRNSGIAAQLYATLARNAFDLGYAEAECSWIVEDNRAMNRSLRFLGAERYKTYRVYEAGL